ncbi:hypothetical protein [Paenibacillus sp. YYML68]|uniref:hypothetical protein n=1 Tax=Paenibacillus sp. YYML68 TaxID=2909250 RepID=UPI0024939878|nr:hypothetical protein [Paenibacillus sp. YYML68]
MNTETQIVETVSGTWLRFPTSFRKFHCLVELPGQLSLNINLKSGLVHVHKKDSNDVYQPVGELSLSAAGTMLNCNVRSFRGTDLELLAAQQPVRQSDAS